MKTPARKHLAGVKEPADLANVLERGFVELLLGGSAFWLAQELDAAAHESAPPQ
jgi:hypothetical protein